MHELFYIRFLNGWELLIKKQNTWKKNERIKNDIKMDIDVGTY